MNSIWMTKKKNALIPKKESKIRSLALYLINLEGIFVCFNSAWLEYKLVYSEQQKISLNE